MRALGRDLSIRDVLGPDGLASHVHPAWESREGQIVMAEAVLARLRSGGTLAVEAPTGIGKTLAYLVPAILSGQRVLVSTNTKTLQEQIIEKDIPLLASVFAQVGIELIRSEAEPVDAPSPHQVRYSLMKGRSNYLCLDRFDKKLQQRNLPFPGDRFVLEELRDWAQQTSRGDRAELEHLSEDLPIWGEVDARGEVCHGARCPRYEECFVVRMRREAQQSDLVIVNHHLLLADLALRAEARLSQMPRGFGEIIPRCDALIVDEAHTLEETASEYFGGSVSSHALARLERDTREWLLTRPSTSDVHGLGAIVDQAMQSCASLFDALPITEGRARIPGRLAVPDPVEDSVVVDDPWEDLPWRAAEIPSERPAPVLIDPYDRARDRLEDAVSALRSLGDAIENGPLDPAGEGLARRATGLAEAVAFILAAEDSDFVYWAERKGRHTFIGASPIDVSSLLREHLFGAFESVALTSATLSVGGPAAFDFYVRRVGAPPETEELLLESPFEYKRQVGLYLPPSLPHPDSPEYVDHFCRTAEDLIDLVDGGAFLLFTSHRMMRLAHDRLSSRLRHPILLQGSGPKRSLIEQFIERSPAVLFGTGSFWEGVDVPGDPLRLVLIDRLPFSSPADPMVAARAERIEAHGDNAFSSYQVPQAILRLKQAFGRLVRTRTDRGVVAIFDQRVKAKSYGQRFLRALPPARRLTRREDLEAWLVEAGMLEVRRPRTEELPF